MKYTASKIGRTFVLKFDHNDDLLEEFERFIKKERVKAGFFIMLGAMRDGRVVAGPKKPEIPPKPKWKSYTGAWEIAGTGSVFPDKKNKKHIHLHASFGKGKNTLTGCVRGKSKVFLVVEAFVIELKSVKAAKEFDAKTGLSLLKIAGKR